jgi:histidinol-phosphate aminotransferase
MIARHVRKLEAYVPGEQPRARRVVKLNTNENPYPPSPSCAEVLKRFDPDRLRRYPDPVFTDLREELAKLNGATPENIFVGNGSDEVLSIQDIRRRRRDDRLTRSKLFALQDSRGDQEREVGGDETRDERR